MLIYLIVYPIVETKPSLINQQTMIFTQFVVLQIFNEVLARQLYGELDIFKGILRNPYFIIIMIAIATIQFIMVQFGSVLGTEPLNYREWLICLGFGIGDILFILVTRLVLKLFKKPVKKDIEHIEITNVMTSTVLHGEE